MIAYTNPIHLSGEYYSLSKMANWASWTYSVLLLFPPPLCPPCLTSTEIDFQPILFPTKGHNESWPVKTAGLNVPLNRKFFKGTKTEKQFDDWQLAMLPIQPFLTESTLWNVVLHLYHQFNRMEYFQQHLKTGNNYWDDHASVLPTKNPFAFIIYKRNLYFVV